MKATILTIGIIVIGVVASGLVTTPGSSANASLLTEAEMESFVGGDCWPCKTTVGENDATGACRACVAAGVEGAGSTHKHFTGGTGIRTCSQKESEITLNCSPASGTINCGSGKWEFFSNDSCDPEPDWIDSTTTHQVKTAQGDAC